MMFRVTKRGQWLPLLTAVCLAPCHQTLAATHAVVHIDDHPQEAAAWSAWRSLQERHPQATAGLQPQVVERDWVYTLIGIPNDGDAQGGCQRLRRAGHQCFVTEARFNSTRATSSVPPEPTPTKATRAGADESTTDPSDKTAPPEATEASGSREIVDNIETANGTESVEEAGTAENTEASGNETVGEPQIADAVDTPSATGANPPQSPLAMSPTVDAPAVAATGTGIGTNAVAHSDGNAPSSPAPSKPRIQAVSEERPGMQLALYHQRELAEQGWQLLVKRFPDLLTDTLPVYRRFQHYIALQAVVDNPEQRDALCAGLRLRGAECIPTSVPLPDGLSAWPAPDASLPDESSPDQAPPEGTSPAQPAVDGAPESGSMDASAARQPAPELADDIERASTEEARTGESSAGQASTGQASIGEAAPEDQPKEAAAAAPPPEPPPKFAHGGPTFDYAASPLGPDSILISIADRKLLYQARDGTVFVWPVAVGRHWSYHIFGDTEITQKRAHPTWTPPPDMRKRNPKLPRSMGPGPHNPLGAYALNLGFPYIRIHGTNKPYSVGRATSSGCYRMHADAIKFLFRSVSVGTPVRVSPKPLAAHMQVTAAQ